MPALTPSPDADKTKHTPGLQAECAVEALILALVEARRWVESAVSPIRTLSPVAAAPGEAVLRQIDAALALALTGERDALGSEGR